MKLKIIFVVVIFVLPIFAFAATQYAPSSAVLRAQALDAAAMERYYANHTIPVAPSAPAYTAPSAQPVASNNNVVAGSVTAVGDIISAGRVRGREGEFGLASVYIGSDTIGNYIKATGTATTNFLRIMIGTTASNAVEKMRIMATGFIGIGTTNPTANLHVVNNNTPGVSFGLDSNKANSRLIASDTINGAELSIISALASDQAKGSLISFTTQNSLGSGKRMIITKDGNIGIGTSDPRIRLDIKDDTNYVNSGLRIAGRYTEAVIRTIGSNVIISANKILGITDPSGVTPGGFSFETTDQWGALRNPLMILSDGKVKFNNEICLPDGTSPSSTVSKCFRYTCPNPGGLGWILSDVLCSQLGKG